MYLAHDPELDFYYYGEIEPEPGMFRKYLTDPKLIAADVETISLKDRTVMGIGVSPNPTMGFYFPINCSMVPWHLLQNPKVTKIFQNAPFDLLCLHKYGIYNDNIRDTNVMAMLLSIRPSKLVDLSQYVYDNGGRNMEVHQMSEYLGGKKTTLDLDPELLATKCCQDTMATFEIYNHLLPNIDMDYFLGEMELMPIFIDMSVKGLKIDQEARYILEKRLQGEVDYYVNLAEGEGFNPASPQQVGYILARRGAYDIFKKIPFNRNYKTKKISIRTDEEILNKMDDPLASLVLEFRKKAKLLGTYIKPWAGADRAYTRYHLDSMTGRPSSTERNMQNIPQGEPRRIFLPDDGIFTDLDFSQLELRVLAYLSGDQEMQYILNNPNGDIHQETANFLDIERRIAKNVSFAMIYGGTDETIAETAGIRSISRAKQLKEEWFMKFREAGNWIQARHEEALNYPFATTLFGRTILLPTLEEESVGGIHRKAVNYPIQACLPASTQILVKQGWIPIGEFQSGDIWTGECWAKAVKLNKGKARRLRLYLSDGREYDCDDRHYLLTHDMPWSKWTHVEEIFGKPLALDTYADWGEPYGNVEDWYWLGRFIGDGYLNQTTWGIAFGYTETTDAKSFIEWAETKSFRGLTNSKTGINVWTDNRGNIKVWGGTKNGKQYWEDMGITPGAGAMGKRIPAKVFQLDYIRRKALFDGYYAADGRKPDNWRRPTRITSVSRTLLIDTLKLMYTIGLSGRISKGQKITNKWNYWYELYIHKELQPVTVMDIDILGKEEMFTLSVEDDKHAFSSEGLISKNSAAEILKRALVRCKEYDMRLQVHDEILFDGHVIPPRLDDIAPFWTPVEIKYLERWE